MIAVTVVEAWPDKISRHELELADGATLREALDAAGLGDDADIENIGLWGQRVPINTALENGDRIERYRPVIADAKQARHRRANDQGYRWQARTRRAARSS
ncbi:MAG: RnfH family protein [Rhizobacter sp.]|nr:RnfH family protein [Burkholderiales bacterium]